MGDLISSGLANTKVGVRTPDADNNIKGICMNFKDLYKLTVSKMRQTMLQMIVTYIYQSQDSA